MPSGSSSHTPSGSTLGEAVVLGDAEGATVSPWKEGLLEGIAEGVVLG